MEEERLRLEAEMIKEAKRQYIRDHLTPKSEFLKRLNKKMHPGPKYLNNVNYIFIWVTPQPV